MLIDQGAVVPGKPWQSRLDSMVATELPTTLTGVLQARLDDLPPELRRAMQLAAVVGHVFWNSALAELDVQPDSVLAQLVARRLVVSRALSSLEGMHEYAFGHHALHRVCHDRMLNRHLVLSVPRGFPPIPGLATS